MGKTNLYYTTKTTKKLVEFWNRSNHMRQQQTILVIKLQQSFILPFFFDCKKTYSLSLISENQNIIIDKTKLEKRNVIIDYSLLNCQVPHPKNHTNPNEILAVPPNPQKTPS